MCINNEKDIPICINSKSIMYLVRFSSLQVKDLCRNIYPMHSGFRMNNVIIKDHKSYLLSKLEKDQRFFKRIKNIISC